MRILKSVVLTNDALGERISAIYAVIDDKTGKVLADNLKLDQVIMNKKASVGADLFKYAQDFITEDEKIGQEKEPIIEDEILPTEPIEEPIEAEPVEEMPIPEEFIEIEEEPTENPTKKGEQLK